MQSFARAVISPPLLNNGGGNRDASIYVNKEISITSINVNDLSTDNSRSLMHPRSLSDIHSQGFGRGVSPNVDKWKSECGIPSTARPKSIIHDNSRHQGSVESERESMKELMEFLRTKVFLMMH